VQLPKSKWKRVLVGAMVALLTMGLVAGCGTTSAKKSTVAPGEKKDITIGYNNWAEDVAVTNLWKVLLEEKGYNVKIISLKVAPLFVGLNKGDLDFFMDAWLPVTHKSYYDKYKDGLEDYGIWYTGEAKMGLVVPKYLEKINSIEDLNANKALFDSKITGCDPGDGLMKATGRAITNYGLDFELIPSSEAAMLTALDKAYRDKKPIVLTGWSPHWMFAKYDLKYIADPKKDYGEIEDVHTMAHKGFSKTNPEVARMLKAFKFDDKQVAALETLITGGMEPEAAAKKWIADNRAVADSFIK